MLPKPMQYSNRLVYTREIEAQQRLHRHRLATMRPTSHTNSRSQLDMARPETMDMVHLKVRAKKMQSEQARLEEIQQDNLLLLKKMHTIMAIGEDTPAVEFAPGVRITRNQVPISDTFVSNSTNVRGAAVHLESLQEEKRRREREKIERENLALLNRITYRKSEFDREKWAADRAREQEFMQRISKDSTAGHLARSGTPGSTSCQRLPPMSDSGSSEFKDFLSMYGVDAAVLARASSSSKLTSGGVNSDLAPRFTASLRPYSTPLSKSPIRTGGAVGGRAHPRGSTHNKSAPSSAHTPVDFMTTRQAQSMLDEASVTSAGASGSASVSASASAADSADDVVAGASVAVDDGALVLGSVHRTVALDSSSPVAVVLTVAYLGESNSVRVVASEEDASTSLSSPAVLTLPWPEVAAWLSVDSADAVVQALQALQGAGGAPSESVVSDHGATIADVVCDKMEVEALEGAGLTITIVQ